MKCFRTSMSLVLAVLATIAAVAGNVHAADWGNLTGTFVFDGAAPAASAITPTKDQEYCGKHKLFDEKLVVNSENKGIANIVVFMYLARGKTAPVHESYKDASSEKIKLDNNGCRFEPHIILLRTSQTLLVNNADPIGHNTKIDTVANKGINPNLPAGASLEEKFKEEERLPSSVSCSIHPWMNSWLLIKDSPYMAVTDADGKFEIANVPAGEWTFQFWHETAGYVRDVKVNGKAAEWSKGRTDVKIAAGKDTDLGTVAIGAKAFESK